MPFCSNCGNEVREEDKFCFSCGTNLKEVQHEIRTEEITLQKRDKRVSKEQVEPLEAKPTEIDKHQSRQASLDDRPASSVNSLSERNAWIIFVLAIIGMILTVILATILD